jgi:uncharacterized protein YecT (DUF1311 family)
VAGRSGGSRLDRTGAERIGSIELIREGSILMFRPLILSLLLAVTPLGSMAHAGEDPIDEALTKCLDAPDGQSTQGMVECLGAAYEAWDSALNAAYAELIKSLAPEQAAQLRTAQRAWLAFRDAERDFLGTLVTPEAGSIMRITTNEAMVDIVKARVLQLRSHLESEDGN